MILTLHHQGKNNGEISQITGSKATTVANVVALYAEGKKMAPEKFANKKLTDEELCKAIAAVFNRKK